MKQYTFSIYFTGAGEEVVNASSTIDAVILACAERIKKGKHIDAFGCNNRDTGKYTTLDGSRPALTVNFGLRE